MGTNWPWSWRLAVFKTIKMTLIRPLHDQFQDDCQGRLCCSAYSSFPLPITPWNSPLKTLAPRSAAGSLFFGIWVHLLPNMTGFLNNAIFPFTQHLSLSGLPLWRSWERICLKCRRPGFHPWVGKISWRRESLPTPIFWPREFRSSSLAQRTIQSMGLQESDTTEQLSLSLFFSQYLILEQPTFGNKINKIPMDSNAWITDRNLASNLDWQEGWLWRLETKWMEVKQMMQLTEDRLCRALNMTIKRSGDKYEYIWVSPMNEHIGEMITE